MKKEYISPELTFIKVQAQDVICLSDDAYVDGGFDEETGDEGIFG